MNNTLHLSRERLVRSSFGIVKVPFTLAVPIKRQMLGFGQSIEPEQVVRDVASKLGVVARVKMCSPSHGWIHFSGNPFIS